MRVALPLVVVAILIAAASWYRAESLERRIAQLERTVPAKTDGAPAEPLTDRVGSLESAVKTLSESFFAQANDVSELKQDRERLRKARIDLDAKTFARLDTQLGPLFVQAEGVRRKPEDTTVDLLIGNPSSATFVDATIRARWGRAYEPNSDYQLWQDGLKEREFPIKDGLRPGAWNRYALHLDTGPVTLLGFLEISFDAKTVQMQEVTTTSTTTLRSTTTTRPADEPRDAGPPRDEDMPEPDTGTELDTPKPVKPVSKPTPAPAVAHPGPASTGATGGKPPSKPRTVSQPPAL